MHVLIGSTLVNRHLAQRVLDLRGLGHRNDALASEHADVRLRCRDVIRQQALINVERLRQREHIGMEPTLEPSAPERPACLGSGHVRPSRRA